MALLILMIFMLIFHAFDDYIYLISYAFDGFADSDDPDDSGVSDDI